MLAANWQGISDIEIASPIKDWFFSSKNATVGLNHGFNDISVDFSWALVRSNGDVVVMNISSWHVNLNMIGT